MHVWNRKVKNPAKKEKGGKWQKYNKLTMMGKPERESQIFGELDFRHNRKCAEKAWYFTVERAPAILKFS